MQHPWQLRGHYGSCSESFAFALWSAIKQPETESQHLVRCIQTPVRGFSSDVGMKFDTGSRQMIVVWIVKTTMQSHLKHLYPRANATMNHYSQFHIVLK